jgi:hypothetical protein
MVRVRSQTIICYGRRDPLFFLCHCAIPIAFWTIMASSAAARGDPVGRRQRQESSSGPMAMVALSALTAHDRRV